MTVTVRYIGTLNPYFEVAVTGKPTKWTPGRTGDVGDADAALLIATGSFEVYADRPLPFAFNQAGGIAGVRLPSGGIASVGVASTTVAALAAGAMAGTLTPGLSIDENGVSYVITSATTYYPLAASTHLGTMTFATALAYPSLVTGMTFNASDVGNQSPLYRYDGSKFRPAGGRQLAFTLGTDAGQTTGPGNGTEVVLAGCSCAFPIGSLDFTGAAIFWQFGITKEAANAESPNVNLRIGATNDAAGTVLAGPFAMTAATARNAGGQRKAVRQSATTLRLTGRGQVNDYDGYDGSNNTVRPPATACANTGSSINYLNLCAQATTPFAEYIVVSQYDIYVMG